VFGKIVSGMDIVHAIEASETNHRDSPLTPVQVTSITIQEG